VANEIKAPYPLFTDAYGDPIDAGYIYIGAAGSSPESSQITVYFDEDLTVPAAQPIRTIGGFPSKQGSPAKLYTSASDYSIRVKDITGSTIFNSMSSNLSSSTGQVNAQDYGLLGNGEDDTAALDAFAAAIEGGAGWIPPGTYLTDTGLKIPSNCTLYMDEATIKLSDTADLDAHAISNSENTGSAATNGGNENITVIGGTGDGNSDRLGAVDLQAAKGCGVSFAGVTGLVCERLTGINGALHSFDVACAEYTTSSGTGPFSSNVTLINCNGIDPGTDDAITLHYVDDYKIYEPRATITDGHVFTTTHQHGVEIDDGCSNGRIYGGYAEGYVHGLQIKGHQSAEAAKQTKVSGFTSKSCVRSYQLTHNGTEDNTEIGLSLNQCTSITPVHSSESAAAAVFAAEASSRDAACMFIEDYRGAKIRDFVAIGDPDKDGSTVDDTGKFLIGQNVEDIDVDGVYLRDINRDTSASVSDQGVIKFRTDSGQNNRIRNILAEDCYAPIIRVEGTSTPPSIENVRATLSVTTSPLDCVVWAEKTVLDDAQFQCKNIVANDGYTYAISNDDADAGIPKGINQTYGRETFWARANSDAGTAGDAQVVHSVGWAAAQGATQDIGIGESVGYGAKFNVEGSGVYTGAAWFGYKSDAGDNATGMHYAMATRADGDAGTEPTIKWVVADTGNLRPFVDDTYKLGTASYRINEIFCTNATINTSDERDKQQVRDLSDSERAVAQAIKGKLKAFKWNSAVEKKGDDARIHFGVMAQEVQAAFEAEGLDAHDYGLFCYDEWQPVINESGETIIPGGNRYGVRYNELMAFLIATL
jgi:hypothetical protein